MLRALLIAMLTSGKARFAADASGIALRPLFNSFHTIDNANHA